MASSSSSSSSTTATGVSQLAIHFSCHDFILSLEAKWIERLVLAEDAKVHETIPWTSRPRDRSAAGLVVESGDRFFAGWDIGEMLGMPPLKAAWILLWVPFGPDRDIPLALRTGSCHVVQQLPVATALPNGIFTHRRSALASAFDATPLRLGEDESPVGVLLDPMFLWTPSELVASEALVLKMHEPR